MLDGDPAPSPKRGRALSPILRVEVIISKLDRKCGALPVVASFVVLEQEIILVKPEVNRFRNKMAEIKPIKF